MAAGCAGAFAAAEQIAAVERKIAAEMIRFLVFICSLLCETVYAFLSG